MTEPRSCPFADEYGCDPSIPEPIRVVVFEGRDPEEYASYDMDSYAFPAERCYEVDGYKFACGCRWWDGELPDVKEDG